MDEKVDIIDKNGQILRQALKVDAHKHGWLHKTVIGWLRYGDDWALVKQAGDRQDAGQLVAPVGGHVQAGEPDEAALLREIEEEIGTSNVTHIYVGSAVFHRQIIGRDENHLFVVFEIATPDPIKLSEEAVSIERFSQANLTRLIATNPGAVGDAMYFVLETFYPSFLPPSYQKRWT